MRPRHYDELSDSELADAAAELKRRERLAGFDCLDWGRMENGEYVVKKSNVFREVRRIERSKDLRAKVAQMDADEIVKKERARNGR